MPQPAIRVENLSKLYRIGTRANHADTLRERLTHALAAPFRRLFGRNGDQGSGFGVQGSERKDQGSEISDQQSPAASAVAPHPSALSPNPSSPLTPDSRPLTPDNSIWALKDVSFEVQPGEVVGIIGRNGAGKSTLLKILSRITEPTAGRVEIRGRVASLLEVGTGFHPELTGRENIYLNGSILGMTNREVDKKFDEIVDFAEIEKFIDTPVKRYSSGMYTRLAFAVAAHLEPEILLVDEVLVVGDAAFQKKCLGKMHDVAKQGRTVLFVSHYMPAVRQLCRTAMLFAGGEIVARGASGAVVQQYLQNDLVCDSLSTISQAITALPPDPAIRLLDVKVSQHGMPAGLFATGKPLDIAISYQVLKLTPGLRLYFTLFDTEGVALFRSFCGSETDDLPSLRPGRYVSKAIIPADLLAPIVYEIGVSASVYNVRHCLGDGLKVRISVEDAGRIKNAYAHTSNIGVKLAPCIPWTTELYAHADSDRG